MSPEKEQKERERLKNFKLTNSETSKELLDIIIKLEDGKTVTLEEINKTPEIKTAREMQDFYIEKTLKDNEYEGFNKKNFSTIKLPVDERRKLVRKATIHFSSNGSVEMEKDENGKEHEEYTGGVKRNRRLDVVIGLPASGKSTCIVNDLSQEYKARVLDNDEVKKILPEFNGGWCATQVHEESSLICNNVFDTLLEKGDNIILPKVGSNADKLVKDYLAKAKLMGYSINIHYVELDRNKALGRMLGRLVTEGRFLEPELPNKYAPILEDGSIKNKITEAYEELKEMVYIDDEGKEQNVVDGFTKWSTDHEFGEPNILLENIGCEGNYIDKAKKEMKKDDNVRSRRESRTEQRNVVDLRRKVEERDKENPFRRKDEFTKSNDSTQRQSKLNGYEPTRNNGVGKSITREGDRGMGTNEEGSRKGEGNNHRPLTFDKLSEINANKEKVAENSEKTFIYTAEQRKITDLFSSIKASVADMSKNFKESFEKITKNIENLEKSVEERSTKLKELDKENNNLTNNFMVLDEKIGNFQNNFESDLNEFSRRLEFSVEYLDKNVERDKDIVSML